LAHYLHFLGMRNTAPSSHTVEAVSSHAARQSLAEPILWWTSGLPCGGVERQILINAEELARRGVFPHLFCDSLSSLTGNDFFLPEARRVFRAIHSLESASKILQRHAATAPDAANILQHLSKRGRRLVTMYIAFFMALRPRLFQVWNADFLLPPLAAVLAGIPKVIICGRSLSPHMRYPLGLGSVEEHFAHRMLTSLLQYPGVTLTNNSTPGCAEYADWLGIARHRVVFTPNAFDADAWPLHVSDAAAFKKSLDIPENAPVIGSLFRAVPVKDPGLWLQTATAILQRNPEAVAVLGGDGPLLPELQRAVSASSMASRFRLPGVIRDPAPFYQACSVFLLTSHVEGCPNVVLEAQFNRVPVVSTPAGGVVDIVEHGRTGFIVQERDPRILAVHADSILRNPEWAARAGEVGRERVLRLFSKERSADAFMRLYREGKDDGELADIAV
jgi:glycosyltransferase involved in cell wall biosynthesis